MEDMRTSWAAGFKSELSIPLIQLQIANQYILEQSHNTEAITRAHMGLTLKFTWAI